MRDAVNAANVTAGADDITFADSFFDANPSDNNFSITLASELAVTESLAINGFEGAALSISGSDATRLFRFGGNGANTYTLNNLTLAHGNGIGASEDFGGAIQMIFDSDDELNINDSVIRDSAAQTSGGGLYISDGTLNITNSAILNNHAAFGGGLNFVNGIGTLKNVTISGNQASVRSGGLNHRAGGAGSTSRLTIQNTTIVNNRGAFCANLSNISQFGASSATVTYQNTIFALPQGGVNVSNHDIEGGTGATITSLGNNISDDDTGNLDTTGDKPGRQLNWARWPTTTEIFPHTRRCSEVQRLIWERIFWEVA